MAYISTSRAIARPARRFSLMTYIGLYRQRRALAALDENQLKDIGISAEEAHKEANRPIWDAPTHWR